MSNIGERMKELRKELHLSQTAFGERLRVSKSHISNIETGGDTPSDMMVKLACMEFNINEDWLCYGTGDKYNPVRIIDKANIKLELIEGIESLNIRILDLTDFMKQGPDEEVTQISYCLSSVIDMLRNAELDGELRFDYFDALENLFSDLGRYIQSLSYTTKISYEKNIDEKARDIDNILCKYEKPFTRAFEEISEVYLQKYIQGYESLKGRGELSAVAEEAVQYAPVIGLVAAGPPILAVEDHNDIIPIPGSKKVDYALVIKGDSMEPEFPNQSIVLVKHQDTLENGEVGIFLMGDEATCKKFYRLNGHVELRSINEKYAPIIVSNRDVRILGKVIKN